MIPICLHGHQRPVTQIKYNREGDLIFTASKDNTTSVWYTDNGERLGTYNGHRGAVFSHDVSYDTERYVTASGDFHVKYWDTELGVCLNSLEFLSPQTCCAFSSAGNLILVASEAKMGQPSQLSVYDVRDRKQIGQPDGEPLWRVAIKSSELSDITKAVWGPYSNSIITGHVKGEIASWDARTGVRTHLVHPHKGSITDMQMHRDQTFFITSSKDHTAKLFDVFDLSNLKTYMTDRQVNSASISPTHEYVIVGGGQEAREVTTTAQKQGKFEARLFHLVYEEEFGHIKGHFGPINSISFRPDGKGYSSGGEDGYVRMHQFDSSYFDFNMDVED
jgi:translation initiation factor 3 subunit I